MPQAFFLFIILWTYYRQFGKIIIERKSDNMSEKELDSSTNNYIEIPESKYNIKKSKWDMAIGLQEVDNLSPSEYLEELLDENIKGEISVDDIKNCLRNYYEEKEKNGTFDEKRFECDFVSTRIVELLNEDYFELSVDYFKYIHKYLFQDIYDFAGNFREIDISKKEKILNNDTVLYGDKSMLNESLIYDLSMEKEKNYIEEGIVSLINGITKFTSDIWQIHPFREGNTRTTAVFIQKYLINLNYKVNNSVFKEKSTYYRNALVRSCYTNYEKSIKEDYTFLTKFYENIILGKNHELHSEDLIVTKLF